MIELINGRLISKNFGAGNLLHPKIGSFRQVRKTNLCKTIWEHVSH